MAFFVRGWTCGHHQHWPGLSLLAPACCSAWHGPGACEQLKLPLTPKVHIYKVFKPTSCGEISVWLLWMGLLLRSSLKESMGSWCHKVKKPSKPGGNMGKIGNRIFRLRQESCWSWRLKNTFMLNNLCLSWLLITDLANWTSPFTERHSELLHACSPLRLKSSFLSCLL